MSKKKFIRQREQREKKRIARERVNILFTLAERVFPYEPELANRYVEIALAVQQKAKIRMPKKWKRRYCKKCHSFLVPGVNARVRLRRKRMPHVVVKCLNCGHIMRYPYLKEQKEKRRKIPRKGKGMI
ncbi:ribonuclease P protein component 4 [Thermococcus sp. GR7]|uniref:ribonuclease P protein component 4 n=1 Tax=unclassified Thermococcus TaxID=2627626 RepID=UPI00143162CA|nr:MULTISPECIES: ribonuclease P protein component 4 [unclassified Thermococcus]NJE47822.1 ribonuclease P protein component 4 [Thermococcus sp. GR7]NJE78534.1 ribonuclease P protein component 4 [Thermococcus sp. GR4]NJF24023.1 ribonuclease P protein component 4 [Thermococcus sp. GR5]